MDLVQPVSLVPALPPTPAASSSKQSTPQLIFEFTKRKKWADILVTELTEVIMLVLSDAGVIWYCGPAVKDLLGWTDEELVDMHFSEIMNGAYQTRSSSFFFLPPLFFSRCLGQRS